MEKLFGLIALNNSPTTVTVLTLLKNVTEGMQPGSLLLSDPAILLTKLVNFFE